MSLELIKTDVIYKGRMVNFQIDTLRTESGREMKREVLIHPGAAVMIPILDAEHVVMVRQYRHAAERNLLEFPAGTLEPGETTEACAHRELIEEIGYEAKKMRAVLSFYPTPGISQEKMFIFVAEGLEPVGAHAEEDEDISIEIKEIKNLLPMIGRGEIVDAKTMIGAYYLMSRSFEGGWDG